jgi:ATP-dependent Clp protease protease subunit
MAATTRNGNEPTREQLEMRKLAAQATRYEQLARVAFFEAEASKREHEWNEASDEQSGVYAFWHDVTRESVFEAVRELAAWSRSNERKPLRFEINSPGGEVPHGLALYDFLRELSNAGHRIETVGIGEVASMGSVILQAGDHRVLTQNSILMMHQPMQSGPEDESSWAAIDRVNELKRTEKQLLGLLAARATVSRAELRKLWDKRDLHMTPREAIAYGLCDEVRGSGRRKR